MVSVDESHSYALYLFQVVDTCISAQWGLRRWKNIPSLRIIVVKAADLTEAKQSLKFCQKNPSVLLALFTLTVSFPLGKVFTDGDSKKLTTVYHFQGVAVNLVAGID